MHTVNQIVDIITQATGKPRSRVSLLARRLTDGGVLPKSRGRQIKLVDRSAAVALLFAAVRAERVEDAVSTSKEFAALRRQGSVIGYDPRENKTGKMARATFEVINEPPSLSLAECLGKLLAHDEDRRCMLSLTRHVDGQPSAIVKFQQTNGVNISLIFSQDAAGGGGSGETFTINVSDFDALRELLARDGGVSFTGAASGVSDGGGGDG